jgi:hypothetical protein
MKRRQSLTSPNKISTVQVLIEKILLSKYRLNPYFWNKSKCTNFDSEIYTFNKRLYQCLAASEKKYGADILWSAVSAFDLAKNKKLAEAAKYNKKSAIIATINYYCNKELARAERLAAPKDTSDPEPLKFSPGEDLRKKVKTTNRRTIWEFMHGSEEEISTDRQKSNT